MDAGLAHGLERGELVTRTKGPGAAAMIPVLTRTLLAAEYLRSLGAEPQRAIAVPLRECDLPPELVAVVRATWAFAVGAHGSGPGAAATAHALARLLAPVDMLCSLGAKPLEAITVLRWTDAPDELVSVARDAWAFAVASGAVARGAWSLAVDRDDDTKRYGVDGTNARAVIAVPSRRGSCGFGGHGSIVGRSRTRARVLPGSTEVSARRAWERYERPAWCWRG